MNKLVEYFNNNQQVTDAIIIAKTVVKMNKKDVATKTEINPYDLIEKVQTYHVTVNKPYQESVQDQMIKEGVEGTFTAQKRKMGGKKINNCIIEKEDGQLYIQTILNKGDVNPTYYHKDQLIEKALFNRFIPISSHSTRQPVENEVKVCTFKIENIVSVEINGQVVYTK